MIGISEYLGNKLSMQTLNSKLSQQGQLSCSLAFQMTRILIIFKDNGDKKDMGECKLMLRVSSKIKDNISEIS